MARKIPQRTADAAVKAIDKEIERLKVARMAIITDLPIHKKMKDRPGNDIWSEMMKIGYRIHQIGDRVVLY